MDAYNRGYGSGLSDGQGATDENGNDIDGLGGEGSLIGNARVIRQDISESAQTAGFYAVAYQITGTGYDGLADGQTVISYRGTDAPLSKLASAALPVTAPALPPSAAPCGQALARPPRSAAH